MAESRLIGPVRVVGAGLLGTSVGLGLRARGIDVILADASPTHVAIAVDLGGGRAAQPADSPQLIVVAVPPDVTAAVIADELAAFTEALVTDVASVKAGIPGFRWALSVTASSWSVSRSARKLSPSR